MKIIVNGEARTMDPDATIATLLDELQLDRRRVAVEVNRQLVPREQHDTHSLQEGDRLEVVTLVGGG